MNNTMNPQANQLTPDEAKASLGIASNLMSQLMPKTVPQTPNSAPQQGQTIEPQKDPMTEIESLKTEIMNELQTIKEDVKMVVKGDVKDERSEIADLKKQIEEVLNSND